VLDFGVGKGQDAIRTLVRNLLTISSESDQEVRAAAADRAVAQGLLSHDRSVYLNDLLDLPQPPELKIVYEAMDNSTRNTGKQEAVAELVSQCSAAQPTFIVVADIHWADPAALAHLATLAGTVMSCPAVLIITSRTEGDPINQAWRPAAGGSPLMTIDLAPLRQSEALELAKEYLETSNRFVLTCIERAEGNPLFIEQLLRSVEEAGEENVPGSVQSLVQWRMDRLPPFDRAALEGRRFEALKHCEKALSISRETGIGFAGPQVLAELALNTDDGDVRRRALKEGEKILREGAVSHNHFNFYADAMDAYLESKEWEEVERYAAALEKFTLPEPLPWCEFFIARGRTLAAYGRGNREDSTIQELRRLRNQAESIGLRACLASPGRRAREQLLRKSDQSTANPKLSTSVESTSLGGADIRVPSLTTRCMYPEPRLSSAAKRDEQERRQNPLPV
jgi:hypothetical protein